MQLKYKKELYPKVVLLKAAYNFTDNAYLHLDADEEYYYVSITPKDGHTTINAGTFENEILAQSVRHEVYQNTKNIRELIMARAMATTVIAEKEITDENTDITDTQFTEEDILKDWFANQ